MVSFFAKLKEGLTKSRQGFVEKVTQLVSIHRKIDEALFEELEEILLQSDVGVAATNRLLEEIRKGTKQHKLNEAEQVKGFLQEKMEELLGPQNFLALSDIPPTVMLVVGVNGVGKTTTIGKLAYRFRAEGKRVLLAAADTFRAAAIEQLEIWSTKAGAELIKHQPGSDPGAVVFDALQAARRRGTDVLIIDTAGRLHTKVNLMDEIRKIKRIIEREIPGAPHEVLLVVDATTGQNALRQAELFQAATGITGIALTKLDGTAKGGIVLAIKEELGVPVKLIGIGEKPDDLKDFNGKEFIAALFGEEVKS
ncbi:MAG: signal recognition particle-docking protein FtsY [Bacillota bacterium]|nr:signal recognition particle-docking protein FtsY [Bacillota bacterium]